MILNRSEILDKWTNCQNMWRSFLFAFLICLKYIFDDVVWTRLRFFLNRIITTTIVSLLLFCVLNVFRNTQIACNENLHAMKICTQKKSTCDENLHAIKKLHAMIFRIFSRELIQRECFVYIEFSIYHNMKF